MKKSLPFILITMLLLISSLLYTESVSASGNEDLEFWIETETNETSLSVQDFNTEINEKMYIELTMMVKSVSDPVSLGGYHFVFEPSIDLNYLRQEENMMFVQEQDGPFVTDVALFSISSNENSVLGSKATPKDTQPYTIPTEGTALFTFSLSTEDYTATELESLSLDFWVDTGD